MGIEIKRIVVKLRAFQSANRGNVAMMFALSMVPIIIAAGAGLDFARGMLVRQQVGAALDAAALAVGSTPGLDATSAQALAQKYFDANYTVDKAAFGSPTIPVPTYDSKGSIVLSASVAMPTVLLPIVNITQLPITATSTVIWGQTKLWVALVLDNSGSMASSGKLTALKNASGQLLTILQNASSTPGEVQVGIVPFTNVVNIGKGSVAAGWIDWSDWEAAPADTSVTPNVTVNATYTIPKTNVVFSAYGPGDDCPFTTTKSGVVTQDAPFGFSCQKTAVNNSGNVTASGNISAIPATGLICPSINSAAYGNDHLARYYNGCWTSTKSGTSKIQVSSGSTATCGGFSAANCSCTATGTKTCSTQKWDHVWIVNNHSSWGGCLMDRAQDYDIQNTQPAGASGFPATNPATCLSATVTPLGFDWPTLNSQVTAMVANGSTNQPVGLANGWQMLTGGDPYGTAALPAHTSRYIILLSDGLNTQDRWWGDGNEGTPDDAKIDARMSKDCAAVKNDGVIVYSIYVNTGGNGPSVPLSTCASDPSKYFVLTSSSQIVTTFNQIAQQITNVRVSR